MTGCPFARSTSGAFHNGQQDAGSLLTSRLLSVVEHSAPARHEHGALAECECAPRLVDPEQAERELAHEQPVSCCGT